MKNKKDTVAVCSRSFSSHPILRSEILGRYQNVKFNDLGASLEGDSLVEFLAGSTKAITALERINDSILKRLPSLKVISKYGVGIDMIDIESMCSHQKLLGWTPGVNRRSVSELVIAFILIMLRHLSVANAGVREGVWKQYTGGQLTGKTIGIIGCGNVGKDLVSLLKSFNCKILVNDIKSYDKFYEANGIDSVSLNDLLGRSDIVTIHIPLNPYNANILNAERLKLLKSTSLLINTSRGGLVDEVALKELLMNKKIMAAAFDVFSVEPPLDKELINLPNFFSTPHIGGSSDEAILAMGRAAIDGLESNQIPWSLV
jgi:phosphoglycerate dehydrogenase-like enzyme